MANLSPNYNLVLPTSPEHYNIDVFNQNNLIIDSELNKMQSKNDSQDELLATKEELTNHNTASTAHSDIRELITTLATRLNALADSDDVTLDQLSEIVDYIKNNKNLIDGITTSKINVSDILNTLALVEANTSSGKVVDALVVKEVLESITENIPSDIDLSNYVQKNDEISEMKTVGTYSNNGGQVIIPDNITGITYFPESFSNEPEPIRVKLDTIKIVVSAAITYFRNKILNHNHGRMKTITYSTTEPTTVAEGEIVMVYEDGDN